jgi:hypothetical protein
LIITGEYFRYVACLSQGRDNVFQP